jgi:hypothetical protein
MKKTLPKSILSEPCFFKHTENRMFSEGKVAKARKNFISNRFRNLDFLLRKRYEWMNDFLNKDDVILEVGCGAGFSTLYLKKKSS